MATRPRRSERCTCVPLRSVFVIGPDKRVKAMLTYPMSTGRNFDEVLRLLDSCQLTAKHKVATPVNWKQGEDVIIVPTVSDAVPPFGLRPPRAARRRESGPRPAAATRDRRGRRVPPAPPGAP